jgi:hypothetical protein
MLEEAFGGDAEGGVLLEAFHEELAEELSLSAHGMVFKGQGGVY